LAGILNNKYMKLIRKHVFFICSLRRRQEQGKHNAVVGVFLETLFISMMSFFMTKTIALLPELTISFKFI